MNIIPRPLISAFFLQFLLIDLNCTKSLRFLTLLNIFNQICVRWEKTIPSLKQLRTQIYFFKFVKSLSSVDWECIKACGTRLHYTNEFFTLNSMWKAIKNNWVLKVILPCSGSYLMCELYKTQNHYEKKDDIKILLLYILFKIVRLKPFMNFKK